MAESDNCCIYLRVAATCAQSPQAVHGCMAVCATAEFVSALSNGEISVLAVKIILKHGELQHQCAPVSHLSTGTPPAAWVHGYVDRCHCPCLPSQLPNCAESQCCWRRRCLAVARGWYAELARRCAQRQELRARACAAVHEAALEATGRAAATAAGQLQRASPGHMHAHIITCKKRSGVPCCHMQLVPGTWVPEQQNPVLRVSYPAYGFEHRLLSQPFFRGCGAVAF